MLRTISNGKLHCQMCNVNETGECEYCLLENIWKINVFSAQRSGLIWTDFIAISISVVWYWRDYVVLSGFCVFVFCDIFVSKGGDDCCR